jgi:NAD(P)-dependent dehydrogenase (short-subunit alcohol dehydrogenase family)
MTGRLEGKVAVITGGASGLGEASARLFVREGARVLIGDVQSERGERIAKEIGDSLLFQHTDVRREEQIAAAVDRAVDQFGKLDCMFANAGIVGAMGPIDEIPAEEWDFTISVNLRGVFLCMKHAARVMKPQGSGSIFCTSSIAGLMGGLGPHAYATTKAALIGFTKNVAAELIRSGIRVNCIAPGNMATEMVAGLATGDPDAIEVIEPVLAATSPLPGRSGAAQDIANAAVYLASDESGFVAGHTLVVDAGLTTGSASFVEGIFSNQMPMVREGGKRGLPTE